MNNTYYNGIPIEQVDFEAEFDKELAALESKIAELKARKQTETGLNHHFWVIKLNRANQALENGLITLD